MTLTALIVDGDFPAQNAAMPAQICEWASPADLVYVDRGLGGTILPVPLWWQ